MCHESDPDSLGFKITGFLDTYLAYMTPGKFKHHTEPWIVSSRT